MIANRMEFDEAVLSLPVADWSANIDKDASDAAITALESGKVIYLPNLGFSLTDQEKLRLDERVVEKGRKNISYRANVADVNGVANERDRLVIKALLARHHQNTSKLINQLLPDYVSSMHSAVNSLRLHPVNQWTKSSSWRKDDRRLHVDAFPSRPIQGQRIIRVFTNIHPGTEARVWRIGDAFANIARHFLPQCKTYRHLNSWLQHKLHITKSRRTHYDHLMLGLHDAMKADSQYQREGRQLEVQFPPDSSWICFSDQTAHAAMSGQFMLEQTYLIPVTAMRYPEKSPLRVLEGMLQKPLC